MLRTAHRDTLLASSAVALLAAVCVSAQSPSQGSAPGKTLGPPLLTVQGRGVQVYRCEAAGTPPAWALDHPEAALLNAQGKVIGHHDAGPAWHLEDGSTVQGTLIEKTPAPQSQDIPWLVLRATAHQGAGLLASAEIIRRTETHGGVAPQQGCDSSMTGATVNVPYSATYTFYGKP